LKAKNHVVKDIQEGNRELLQKNARLETRIRELNVELMRTYRSHDFKTDDLDDTRTGLQHAQDELPLPRATSTTSRSSCTRGTSS
jgi:septal ring factor EnvC (AmiA/AmiB activator)